MNYVCGIGPSTARLAIVGEAPGGEEDRLGLPFVGPTGKINDRLLEEIGSSRDQVYLTNVVKHRPPDNDLRKLKMIGKSIEDYMPQLKEELITLEPNAVIALGNTALEALTGYKGIEKHRGSILKSNFGSFKVIPTLHPASLLHKQGDSKISSWKDLTFIRWDYARALHQSTFKDFEPPRRNLIVCKNALMLYRFFDNNKHRPYVAIDIETFRTIPICIGFAFSRNEAISVPLFNNLSVENPTGITQTDQLEIWRMVAQLLDNPEVMKIGQNFKFDEGQLLLCNDRKLNFGMRTRGFFFDTMLAFRTLYPELPSSLQFITSVLTEEPYYKDEGKEYHPKKDKIERLLLYNAKDAVITYEAFEEETRELQEAGLERFFYERVMPLHQLYQNLENRGIRRDPIVAKKLADKYEAMRQDKQETLDGLIGGPVNVASPKQVAILLYDELAIPVRGERSTEEKVLEALIRNTIKDSVKKQIVELILEIRKIRKTIGTYIEAEPNEDGKLRTSYRIALETGRTSTQSLKVPVATHPMGLAFQTVTKYGDVGSDLREMLIPDPGYVLLEVDQSQAEGRVVALLARDSKMLKMFDYGVDIHRVTAGWIADKGPDNLLQEFFNETSEIKVITLAAEINRILREIIDEENRQLGKKFRHAGHYDMGKRTASENIGLPEWRTGKILAKFHTTNPNIRGVFHREIIEALQANDRRLVNPFSRERQFLNKWGTELFKEGYAQIPQSTVSDQTKFAMLRVIRRLPNLQILQESHDSFLSQVQFKDLDQTMRVIKEEMETPIDFSRCTLKRGNLVIPCEFSIGEVNWKDMKKIKI